MTHIIKYLDESHDLVTNIHRCLKGLSIFISFKSALNINLLPDTFKRTPIFYIFFSDITNDKMSQFYRKMLQHVFFYYMFTTLFLSSVCSHSLDRTAFVIMSQEAHDDTATISKEELSQALINVGVKKPNVVLLHKELPSHGGWTIFPLLDPLLEDYHDLIDWYVFLDEAGTIDPQEFTKMLKKYDHKDQVFLGKALQDKDSVIIHHYSQDFKFKYPDFAAGFVFSSSLAQTLHKELKNRGYELEHFPKDFSIGRYQDPACRTELIFLFHGLLIFCNVSKCICIVYLQMPNMNWQK